MNNFLEIINLSKTYESVEKINILNNINFKLPDNVLVALTGPSGSGKSTLLHILSLLDSRVDGEYHLNGKRLDVSSQKEKNKYRRDNISILFQNFNLINDLNAIENVMLPMLNNNNYEYDFCYNKAMELLSKFNLSKRTNYFPSQLSGGEQQRVAIARALINEPQLILADEPTGNLDNENSIIVINYLKELKKENRTIIFATHNRDLVNKCDLELTIKNRTVISN